MKKRGCILIGVMVLLSCNSKEQPSEDYSYYNEQLSSDALADSMTKTATKETPKEEVKPSTPVRQSVSSYHHNESRNFDNMRGFDPASEDDMDDNGMKRYMENYDNEGWE